MQISARYNIAYFRLNGIKRTQQSYAEFYRLVYLINFQRQITDKVQCINDLEQYMQLNIKLPTMPKPDKSKYITGLETLNPDSWKKRTCQRSQNNCKTAINNNDSWRQAQRVLNISTIKPNNQKVQRLYIVPTCLEAVGTVKCHQSSVEWWKNN